MSKLKRASFGNLCFMNETAQLHYLEQFSDEKLHEIEITTADDFIESFEHWVEKRSLNELFLIWAVLNELEKDTPKLEKLIEKQCETFKIPSWLALSGTLAFYSVHYLNKTLIEEEFKNRNIIFDSYSTLQETIIATNGQTFKVNSNLLKDLKLSIYHDQLDKEYFQELADTITAMSFH